MSVVQRCNVRLLCARHPQDLIVETLLLGKRGRNTMAFEVIEWNLLLTLGLALDFRLLSEVLLVVGRAGRLECRNLTLNFRNFRMA